MENEKELFQEHLRKHVYQYRKSHGLSQEKMAELLNVAPRSYADQERGKYGYSALPLMRYLLILQDEKDEFLLAFLKESRSILGTALL